MFTRKREMTLKMLETAGLDVMVPESGYFVLCDISSVDFPEQPAAAPHRRDYDFCRWLTKDIGVAAIPASCFYSESTAHHGSNLARFAFCKDDGDLIAAGERLKALNV